MIHLDSVRRSFSEVFESTDNVGSALSVWQNGKEVLSLCRGEIDRSTHKPWTPDTLVLWWSATKGPASACLLHLLQEQGLDPSVPVSRLWQEFAQAGKENITIAQLMSHQAGLVGTPGQSIPATDHTAQAAALAAQKPLWEPGTGHGYHPRSFGVLLEECVRRLSGGISLGDYWQMHFAKPLHLDFWIGLPEAFHTRVATIYASRTAQPPEQDIPFYRTLADSGSLQSIAFASGAVGPVSAMNKPELRSASFPAFGGVGSATALAKFYAMLANEGKLDGLRFFTEKTMRWMQQRQVNGSDATFLTDTAFSCGFMLDPINEHHQKTRLLFGTSLTAFGHPGAGGSTAFADSENRIAFAYAINQMSLATLPIRRAGRLVQALYKG